MEGHHEMYVGECHIESEHKSQLQQYILMIYWQRLQWLKWLEQVTYMNEFKSILYIEKCSEPCLRSAWGIIQNYQVTLHNDTQYLATSLVR